LHGGFRICEQLFQCLCSFCGILQQVGKLSDITSNAGERVTGGRSQISGSQYTESVQSPECMQSAEAGVQI